MTKEEAIEAIRIEATCKEPRTPGFMADFAESVIRRIDGVPVAYGGASTAGQRHATVQQELFQ